MHDLEITNSTLSHPSSHLHLHLVSKVEVVVE
ncbi:hypothetical protein HID58_053260 [Brassica napus]|uniref:Uncharacterized protein n=1 Tax=Brassica napus TaxID=3708 RepID=A0ABQ8AE84_BRANA|nr:hypothetical protein HID58_053260 [Brassica napus]